MCKIQEIATNLYDLTCSRPSTFRLSFSAANFTQYAPPVLRQAMQWQTCISTSQDSQGLVSPRDRILWSALAGLFTTRPKIANVRNGREPLP